MEIYDVLAELKTYYLFWWISVTIITIIVAFGGTNGKK